VKKRLSLALGILGLYCLFLVVMLPIGFVLNMVNLPHNIQLSGVKGTIWQSHFDTVIVDNIRIDNVDASLSVLSLLSFHPSVDVTFGDPMLSGIDGHATVSGTSTLQIQNTEINIPANLIAQFVPTPIELTAHKYIELKLETFELGEPICGALVGQIDWRKAAVTVYGQKVDLLDLTADLHCNNGEIELAVKQPNGLGLSLTATLGKNMNMYGQGYIQPSATTPKAIMDVLPLVSRPDGQGRYPLRF